MEKGDQMAALNAPWSGRLDLNQRPLAPHASALPSCATSRSKELLYPKVPTDARTFFICFKILVLWRASAAHRQGPACPCRGSPQPPPPSPKEPHPCLSRRWTPNATHRWRRWHRNPCVRASRRRGERGDVYKRQEQRNDVWRFLCPRQINAIL